MFFIIGTRRSATPFGQFSGPCRSCKKPTTHSAVQSQRRLTLFFIPIIPLGSSYLIACSLCGLRLSVEGTLRDQLDEWKRTGVPPSSDAQAGARAAIAAPSGGAESPKT